jgi:hypothetical protein
MIHSFTLLFYMNMTKSIRSEESSTNYEVNDQVEEDTENIIACL